MTLQEAEKFAKELVRYGKIVSDYENKRIRRTEFLYEGKKYSTLRKDGELIDLSIIISENE